MGQKNVTKCSTTAKELLLKECKANGGCLRKVVAATQYALRVRCNNEGGFGVYFILHLA